MGLIEYSAEMKETTTYSGDPRGCSEATTDSMPRKRDGEREEGRKKGDGRKRRGRRGRCHKRDARAIGLTFQSRGH
jgi:hypothetical protein